MNPVYVLTLHLLNIHFNSIPILRLGLPSESFPRDHQNSVCSACPFHLLLLDLIILTMSDADCPSWSSSLRSCIHPSLTSFVLGATILLSTLFSNTLMSLNVRSPKPCSMKLLKFAHYSVFVWIFRMSIKYGGGGNKVKKTVSHIPYC